MKSLVRQFAISIVVIVSSTQSGRAEHLVMPYACKIVRGQPELSPSSAASYKIVGPRDERPFVSCPATAHGVCETLMIHKFTIGCDGQRMSWAKVASTGRAQGVTLPEGLPAGYAPVSTFSGRFVFPALTRERAGLVQGAGVVKVATAELSPEGIVDASFQDASFESAGGGQPSWVTTVSANIVPAGSGDAVRVTLALAGILAGLALACFLVAGRRYVALWLRTIAWLRKEYEEWNKSAERTKGDDRSGEFANLFARLNEAESLVASLAPGLIMRGVLSTELAQIRERAANADRQKNRSSTNAVSGWLRALLRDIDRVVRMAEGARQPADLGRAAADIPRSAAEAYSVLGLNADVLPAVAKKLVDALRQTWHPDFARNEDDRRRREDRMKQINAAWELIKDQRAAA